MDKRLFHVYLAKECIPNNEAYAKLNLPASPWKVWDAMEKVRLQTDDILYMEIEDYEFNRLLDQCNIHPEITYDTTSDFALLSMVEAGLGVSIVHSLMLKPERYHVAVLPLNVKQSREIGIAVKKGFLPSTIRQLFLQHVVDYTKDMGEITVIRH